MVYMAKINSEKRNYERHHHIMSMLRQHDKVANLFFKHYSQELFERFSDNLELLELYYVLLQNTKTTYHTIKEIRNYVFDNWFAYDKQKYLLKNQVKWTGEGYIKQLIEAGLLDFEKVHTRRKGKRSLRKTNYTIKPFLIKNKFVTKAVLYAILFIPKPYFTIMANTDYDEYHKKYVNNMKYYVDFENRPRERIDWSKYSPQKQTLLKELGVKEDSEFVNHYWKITDQEYEEYVNEIREKTKLYFLNLGLKPLDEMYKLFYEGTK